MEDNQDQASPPNRKALPKKRITPSSFYQLLGLAIRARRATVGSDSVLPLIQSNRAKLVILAVDVGSNAEKKYRDKCAFYHIPMVFIGTRSELGNACGKDQSVVVAVTDPGFAAKLSTMVGELSGGDMFDRKQQQ
jgi:ribosomal protein L7Ae-like RNA K-turn-binding protein